ncbi:UNVERIFIED_CONTAM: Clavaminate synthase-like protein [Sesamum calycinum]|uniref:Clavaminate synthase-like protein n=1 Tax=Sesamum calycinum TaxID=2727403 RepID=A0AAW2NHG6_9LAMI
MKEKYPDFVEKLEKHGLIYTRVLGEDDDPSSPIGRGWKSTFLTKDKSVAEERAAKLNMKLEWTEDGVKTIMGPIPAVKYDETRQCKIWFNSMVAAYTGWEDARNDPKKAVTFGDGNPLPGDIIYDCLKILEEESVAIPWRKGDVLLIDNLAVLHSRRPFAPPRRILASLCK